jgi:hypothetical protein
MYMDARDRLAEARETPLGGFQTNFRENVRPALRDVRSNRLGWWSERLNLETAYDNYIDDIFAATGQRLRNPTNPRAWDVPQALSQPKKRAANAALFGRFHAEADALAAQTGKFQPMTPDDIGAAIIALDEEVTATREEIALRAGAAGKFGGFVGEFAGYMTEPLTAITSLYAPARGAGILMTMARMAIVTGGAEALLQPSVQKYRKELGLDHGFAQAALAVGFVGGTAGLLSGVFKAGGMGLRNLLDLHAEVVAQPSTMEWIARKVVEQHADRVDAFAGLYRNPGMLREADRLVAEGTPMRSYRAPELDLGIDHAPAKLPEHLDLGLVGAKPRYGQSELKFDSDVDLALYIVSEGGWATDANYRLWLKKTLNIETDSELDGLAHRARLRVAEAVKNSVDGDVVTVKAPREAPAPRPAPKLPSELAGARINYQQSTLNFKSDIDRALYVVSQKKKSLRDADYRKWLRGTLDVDDAEIDKLAQGLRGRVKEAMKGRFKGEEVVIESGQPAPAPRPAPTGEPGTLVRNWNTGEVARQKESATVIQEVIEESGLTVDEGLAEMLAMYRGEKKTPDPGPSLIDFLIKSGGLRDTGGEVLELLGGDPRTRPGLINNQTGVDLDVRTKRGFKRKAGSGTEDEAGPLAAAAGYFPEQGARLRAGEKFDMKNDLLEGIRQELAGNKLHVVDERSLHAEDVDAGLRQFDEELNRAGLDPDTMSDQEIAAGFKSWKEGMEKNYREMVEDAPDTVIPMGVEKDAYGNDVTFTRTAREAQDDIDADQKLIDELNICFTPGWDI